MHDIELDSYINELACESIMYNLYASEYQESLNAVNESLLLTFDSGYHGAIEPAFEEVKHSFVDKIKAAFSKIGKIFTTIGNAIIKFISNLLKKKKNDESTHYDVEENGEEVVIVVEEPSSGKRTYKLSKKKYRTVIYRVNDFSKNAAHLLRRTMTSFKNISNVESALFSIYDKAVKLRTENYTTPDANNEIKALVKKAYDLRDTVIDHAGHLEVYTKRLDEMKEKLTKDSTVEITKATAAYTKSRQIDIGDLINHAKEMKERCFSLKVEVDQIFYDLNIKDPKDFTDIVIYMSHTASDLSMCCSIFINSMSKWAGVVY